MSRVNIEDTEKIKDKVAELCSTGSIRLQDRKAASLISLMAKKANNNLKFARLSLRISDSHEMKAALGLKESDSFYDWVIIISYYAMFHIAHALLATKQIRIRKIRVHESTLYAFAQYFIVSKELEEELFFIYEDAEKKQRSFLPPCLKRERKEESLPMKGCRRQTGFLPRNQSGMLRSLCVL